MPAWHRRVMTLLFCLYASSAAAICTQQESEEKVRAAINAMAQMRAADPAKAAAARKKIDVAVDQAIQPSSDFQIAIDQLCKAMDEVLADLRR